MALRLLRLFSEFKNISFTVSVTFTIHNYFLFAKLKKKIIDEFFIKVNFVMTKNSALRTHPVNAISCALTPRIRITCNLKLSEDGGRE